MLGHTVNWHRRLLSQQFLLKRKAVLLAHVLSESKEVLRLKALKYSLMLLGALCISLITTTRTYICKAVYTICKLGWVWLCRESNSVTGPWQPLLGTLDFCHKLLPLGLPLLLWEGMTAA